MAKVQTFHFSPLSDAQMASSKNQPYAADRSLENRVEPEHGIGCRTKPENTFKTQMKDGRAAALSKQAFNP
eukprot:scaffold207653_cov21-Tisochrysis_lutea.AAC.2